MFGRQAYGLLAEVSGTTAETIPPHNEEAFRNALDEIHLQHDRLAEVYAAVRDRSATSGPSSGDTGPSSQSQSQGGWEGTEAEATELMVYHAGILRNKRLLFAYVRARLERIEELRWTRRALPPEVSANLTPAEERYFRSYDRLLSKYMRSGRLGVGVDLTADPLPPEDPFVHVRVLRDYGEVVFSSGKARSMVSLQRGKSHWLPRDEAHPLAMDGILEVISES